MNIYKRIVGYMPGKTYLLVICALLAVTAAVASVLPYYFIYEFLQELVLESSSARASYFALVVLGIMLLYIVTYFLSLWMSHLYAFRLETNLRKKGVDHMMHASMGFFDTHPSGEVRKIIDDNAAETHMSVAHLTPDTIVAITTPILMLALAFYVDVFFGVVFVVLAIFAMFLMQKMTGNTMYMKSYMQALETMNGESIDYVRGIPVIKIFRAKIEDFSRFYEAIQNYSELALKYTKTWRLPFVTFLVLFNLFILIALPWGLIMSNQGMSTPLLLVKVIFFSVFGSIFFSTFYRIMHVGMYHFQTNHVLDRLESLFLEMEEKRVYFGSDDQFDDFSIAFQNVTFGYDDQPVLKDLSFTLAEKQKYALVGPSGGGKSTIAKLISGFYALDSGTITIGGKPITAYTEEALMDHIAFVFQDTSLFKTSIYENVRMGNPEASKEEILRALQLAQCESIINKFPQGVDTVIGAKGVHLSGGEIGRIAVARAILKNADIIILDEATAAADPENEFEMQRAFANLMAGKTVILIAHRLSTIRDVDEILVIDNGQVVERGTHAALMAEKGLYLRHQTLYESANEWRPKDEEAV